MVHSVGVPCAGKVLKLCMSTCYFYLTRFTPNRHFQLSLRYDIGYTRNFNRFLGGISRLSNFVGGNPILLVHVYNQMCWITFVPCFIRFSEGI